MALCFFGANIFPPVAPSVAAKRWKAVQIFQPVKQRIAWLGCCENLAEGIKGKPCDIGEVSNLEPGMMYFPTKCWFSKGIPPKMIFELVTWRSIPVSKWSITMVNKSPKHRVVGPLPNGPCRGNSTFCLLKRKSNLHKVLHVHGAFFQLR